MVQYSRGGLGCWQNVPQALRQRAVQTNFRGHEIHLEYWTNFTFCTLPRTCSVSPYDPRPLTPLWPKPSSHCHLLLLFLWTWLANRLSESIFKSPEWKGVLSVRKKPIKLWRKHCSKSPWTVVRFSRLINFAKQQIFHNIYNNNILKAWVHV